VPGPLIGGLFSYLLGVELPGRGTNYLKQSLDFLAPAPVGETLTASVTITRLRPEKHLVDLETVCETADGTRVCEGRALVYVEDVGKD
jgi:acyl dehydratase